MSDPITTEIANTRRPLWRRVLAFLFLWSYRIAGSVLLFAALFVLVAQTNTFKDWMKTAVLGFVNDQLEGKIYCDEVRLDVFKGIVLVHPTVYADRTLLLEAAEISVTYNLSALLQRIISIDNVTITEPTIRLHKSLKNGWNVEHLVKPSTDSNATILPEGVLFVRSLIIQNARVFINDVSAPWPDNTYFDPTHLSLVEFHLDASLRLNLKASDLSLMVNDLQCKDLNGRLTIEQFHAMVRVNARSVDVQSVQLKTPRNTISFSAGMKDVNIFNGIDGKVLAAHPIYATIDAAQVSGDDLKYFVPDVKLRDTYSLKCTARFDGTNLYVDDVILGAGPNTVFGRVVVTDVEDEIKRGVDIHLVGSTANYADVRRRLELVELPELTFLTTTELDSVHFKGRPADSIWFEVHGRDAVGEVHGQMSLRLNTPQLGYHVNLAVAHGQLSRFSADSAFTTELNGSIVMSGFGTDLNTMQCNASVHLGNSVIGGRSIRQADIRVTANGKGLIVFDTLFADITPVTTATDGLFLPDEQSVMLSGSVDVSNATYPRIVGRGRATGLDIARLTHVESMPSRITGNFQWDFVGFDLDSITGNFNMNLKELVLRDRAMLPFSLSMTSERSGDNRILAIDSDFGDVTLSGFFVPSQLGRNFEGMVAAVSNEMGSKSSYFTDKKFERSLLPDSMQDFDFTLVAEIKDISPVNMFLSDVRLSADLHLRSFVSFESGNLKIVVDTLYTGDVSIFAPDLMVQSDPFTLKGRLSIADIYRSIPQPDLEIKATCDSVITVNGIRIKNPAVGITRVDNDLKFAVQSSVDDQWFNVLGTCRFDGNQATFALDSSHIVVDTARGLEWKSIKPSIVTASSGRFNADGISMQRPWAETIHIDGMVSLSNFTGATVRIENFSLKKISQFVDLEHESPVRLLGGLVNNCTVVANGTWAKPVFDLTVQAKDVSYNGQVIGNLSLKLQHVDSNVSGAMWIADERDSSSKNTLDMVVKSIPLNLALESVSKRLVDNKPIDIEVTANSLSLAAIEPFLPAVENVRGRTDAKIWVRGTTPEDITLGGKAVVNAASFTASSTNITYLTSGTLHLADNNLFIDSMHVRNLGKDLRDGSALGTGVIVFDGLSVDNIDISISTTSKSGIRVMNMASQTRSPELFGDLIIRSGRKPIRLYGRINSPTLEGDVHVLYSDIVLPKERSSTRARAASFEYVRHNDTSYAKTSILDLASNIGEQQSNRVKNDSSKVAEAIKAVFVAPTGSFIDILRYDLEIYLEGRTLLTMIFGPFEILIADLEQPDRRVPLTFTGRFGDNSTNLRGQVRVRDGASSYKFYKPFTTSGLLTFNSGGMTNPVLDLKAVFNDSRYVKDRREDYRVELTITGTKKNPSISYRLWRNNREVTGDSAKIAGDALMLILVGRTQDELTDAGQGNLVNEVNASLSAVATSALGDMLSGNGIFQNTQVDIAADPSQSRLTVIGQIFGNVSYRVSGQISDFAGNSTFTVTVPLSVLNDSEAFRYFLIDFSRSLNQSGNITRQSRDWEIKLGARLP